MQRHVNLVDLVKSFPTNIFLQNLASIQKRTSPLKFAHLAGKSENGSISNLSTKVQDVARRSIPVTLKMYTHLVHTFATAMRLPGTTDNERVVHVRHAWQVVGDARRRGLPLTTSLLNGVVRLYAEAGLARYAVDALVERFDIEAFPDFSAK